MRERGAESAQLLRQLLAGTTHPPRPHRRLPIVAAHRHHADRPGRANAPMREVIDLGQQRMREAPTPRIAQRLRDGRLRLRATRRSTACPWSSPPPTASRRGAWRRAGRRPAGTGASASSPTSPRWKTRCACAKDRAPCPLIFADVADNPGGGGRGNTMCDPRGLPRAPACRAPSSASSTTPPWPTEAHALGVGARFTARFNRAVAADDPFSKPFAAEADSPRPVRRQRHRPPRHLSPAAPMQPGPHRLRCRSAASPWW